MLVPFGPAVEKPLLGAVAWPSLVGGWCAKLDKSYGISARREFGSGSAE